MTEPGRVSMLAIVRSTVLSFFILNRFIIFSWLYESIYAEVKEMKFAWDQRKTLDQTNFIQKEAMLARYVIYKNKAQKPWLTFPAHEVTRFWN